jgi:coproporphyrinogen III oxidase
MIDVIEQIDGSGASFSLDRWGAFANGNDDVIQKMSGGITRVLQGGNVVEKGACSLTIIRDGVLSAERAKAISGRTNPDRGVNAIVRAGDVYSAAALSVVLHTRNPFIPTFRSDVRIFLVKSSNDSSLGSSVAWFGGGSDLTPYYLIDNDIVEFHTHLKELCDRHSSITSNDNLSYQKLKRSCDEYFYLPARAEHRGTGGIFFDDISSSPSTLEFVMDVARGWMPSWLPIVARNRNRKYKPENKQWQCLRRGRYLEFNLLYDRGVRFGLLNENPRVEGVMVSAPPMIAYDYNHVPTSGSEEERLIKILKQPIDWV